METWLAYDAPASADRLARPILMLGFDSIALPTGGAASAIRTEASLKKPWLGKDVTPFDFYDRADVVKAASDSVADFLGA